jgi:hypothetical protein
LHHPAAQCDHDARGNGRIVDFMTGEPVAHATISFIQRGNKPAVDARRFETDSTGRFSFDPISHIAAGIAWSPMTGGGIVFGYLPESFTGILIQCSGYQVQMVDFRVKCVELLGKGKVSQSFEDDLESDRNVTMPLGDIPLVVVRPPAVLSVAMRRRLEELTGFSPDLTSIKSVEWASPADSAVPFLSEATARRALLKITYSPFKLPAYRPGLDDKHPLEFIVIVDADTGTLISIKTSHYDRAAERWFSQAELDYVRNRNPPGIKVVEDMACQESDLEFTLRFSGYAFAGFPDQPPKVSFLASLNPLAVDARFIAAYYVLPTKYDSAAGPPVWMINLVGVPDTKRPLDSPVAGTRRSKPLPPPKEFSIYPVDATTGQSNAAFPGFDRDELARLVQPAK